MKCCVVLNKGACLLKLKVCANVCEHLSLNHDKQEQLKRSYSLLLLMGLTPGNSLLNLQFKSPRFRALKTTLTLETASFVHSVHM